MGTHFSRLLGIGAFALSLGACASPAEIAASDDTACRNTGAKPGTPPYVKCMEERKNQRRVAEIEGQRSMQRMQWEMQNSTQRQIMMGR